MSALEHAQWTELLGVSEYDHIIGAAIVVIVLIIISFKVKKECAESSQTKESLAPSTKFSIRLLFL